MSGGRRRRRLGSIRSIKGVSGRVCCLRGLSGSEQGGESNIKLGKVTGFPLSHSLVQSHDIVKKFRFSFFGTYTRLFLALREILRRFLGSGPFYLMILRCKKTAATSHEVSGEHLFAEIPSPIFLLKLV